MCHDPLQIQLFGRMLRISFYQPEFAEKYASHLLVICRYLKRIEEKDRKKGVLIMVFIRDFLDTSPLLQSKID
jgi:hypothetical protein